MYCIIHRQAAMYEQEKQLRALHLEALRYLWQEVQSLQAWKAQAQNVQAEQAGDGGSVDEGIARLLGSLQGNSR